MGCVILYIKNYLVLFIYFSIYNNIYYYLIKFLSLNIIKKKYCSILIFTFVKELLLRNLFHFLSLNMFNLTFKQF